ncbi:MAG: toll/interleukin-1 receptor domain-containing protein [Pyrinomonadaceae bacterium]
MPTQNSTSHADDRRVVSAGRDSRVSWPFIWAGLGLLALAALMYVLVASYRPAQAATEGEPVKEAQPQPTPEPTPSPTPADAPRSVMAPPMRVRRSPAPRPRRRRKPFKAAKPSKSFKAVEPTQIEVSTHPGGYPLTIDGQSADVTTEYARAIKIEPGAHTVEILFPNDTRWSRVLHIPPGCTYKISLNYRPPRTIQIPVGEVETVKGDNVEIAALGGLPGMNVRPNTFSPLPQVETVELGGDVTGTVCASGAIYAANGGDPATPVNGAQPGTLVMVGNAMRVSHVTRPTATPTPTPTATPPAAEDRERDKIVAHYPARLLKDEDSTLKVEMSVVLKDVVAGTNTTAGGKVETVDTVGAVAGEVNPEARLARRFGPGYKAFATVTLISNDFVTTPGPQPEQLLDPEALDPIKLTWEWRVRPKEGAGEKARFTFQIEVVWVGPDTQRREVWRKEIELPVGLPEGMKVVSFGSSAAGAGGAGAMLAGVLKGRRRKRPGEADDESAGAEPDESAGAEPVVTPADVVVAAAAATATAAVAAAAPVADEVHCTVYAPPEARPGDMLKVQVLAHLEEQRHLLAALAAERDEDAREGGSEKLKPKIERGKELTFTLDMPGLKVKEAERSLVWNGEPDCVRFTVTVPDECKPKVIWGTIEIVYESVPVGEVEFKFKVVTEAAQVAPVVAAALAAEAPPAEQREVMFTKAFISYSRRDSEMVLEKVQMLEAQGVECYLDMMTFRPGEDWKQMINHYIDICDVFFLFWSNASKNSPEVDKEIRYALQRRERAAPRPVIKPIPIEGPPVVTPPPYLSHLHFDDRYRYFIKAKQAERLDAQSHPPAPPGAA